MDGLDNKNLNIDDDKWCVYFHKNKINNKSYIGITSKAPEKRWGTNGCNYSKKNQPAFTGAIKKYGWDNFEHIIFADNLTEKQAKHMEKLLIALYKTNCCKYKNPALGYNMTDGGDGSIGRECSNETRMKISIANKNPSQETREKIRQARIGTKASEETKAKMREQRAGHPGYPHSNETKQKLSKYAKERFTNPENTPMYGKKHTEETKKKIGDGHRNPSKETREKMSASAKARCTDEWKKKMSESHANNTGKNNPHAKKVYQYSDQWDLVKIWDALVYIAEEFHVSSSTISGTWLKNTDRLYMGFHWSLVPLDIITNEMCYNEVI